MQTLVNRICEATFFFFYGLLRLLPIASFRRTAYPFLQLFIHIAIPRKRIIRNLSAAFGQSYSASTKRGLAKGVQEHFITNLMDCFMQISDSEHARKVIDIRGVHHLESALRNGRGVIVLGAHIGNFVLVGTRLGLEGHSFHTLFRIPPDRRIKNVIDKFLPHYHQSVIPSLPKLKAVTRILEALKNNDIVYILGDNLKKVRSRHFSLDNVSPSPRGPISLALRSGAPLVPMYLVRNYQGRLNLIIEPELEIVRNGNLAKNIEENTKRVVQHVEKLIRQYPDQWNWLTVRLTQAR